MFEVRFIYPKVLARHRARGVLSCGLDETLVEEKMAEGDAQIRFLEACQQAEPHTMVAPGEAYLQTSGTSGCLTLQVCCGRFAGAYRGDRRDGPLGPRRSGTCRRF
jgi:hypothetical protein